MQVAQKIVHRNWCFQKIFTPMDGIGGNPDKGKVGCGGNPVEGGGVKNEQKFF